MIQLFSVISLIFVDLYPFFRHFRRFEVRTKGLFFSRARHRLSDRFRGS